MTLKQKDNQLLSDTYSLIFESKTSKKCKCGCNPTSPKRGCKCTHKPKVSVKEDVEDSEEDASIAEAKGKKPEWLYKEGEKKKDSEDSESEDSEDSEEEDASIAEAKGKKPEWLFKKKDKKEDSTDSDKKKPSTKKEVAEALEAIYDQIVLEHRI